MRFRRAVATVVTSFLVLVGAAVPASASSYDQLARMTVDNLGLMMQAFALYDNNRSYAGVTEDDLRRWGWTSWESLSVQVVVEDGGASFWAVAQDTRPGSVEYTVALAAPVGGIQGYAVRASDPQPPAAPDTPGVQIRDEGDQVDVAALAAALLAAGVTSQRLCEATMAVPGTHLARSSLSDQTIACETAVAAGLGTREVLNHILKFGGAAAIASLAVDFVGDGTRPAATPSWVGTPQGRDTTTPRPAPPRLPEGIWNIGRLAAQIARANQLDEPTARVVAEQCLIHVANAFTGLDPYRACRETPIFASGRADVPEATQHDVEALERYPAWVSLNYRPSAQNPTNRSWKDSDPVCQAKDSGSQDCDEYPFFATEQGGGKADPRPSLKAISLSQNRSQGGLYSAFLSKCGLMGNSGAPFLAVPVPESAPSVPTLAICN